MAEDYSIGIPQESFITAKNRNPFYNMHIKCPGLGVEWVCDMPEQITSATAGDYESLMAGAANIGGGSSIADGARFAAGTSVVSQFLTGQTWVGTAPMELPFKLLFDAERNAFEEVYKPLRCLEAIALPSYYGGFLYAPSNEKNTVSLTVGNFFTIPKVILVSVNVTFDTRLDATGYPIAGEADVTFRTIKAYSREDWLRETGIAGTRP